MEIFNKNQRLMINSTIVASLSVAKKQKTTSYTMAKGNQSLTCIQTPQLELK